MGIFSQSEVVAKLDLLPTFSIDERAHPQGSGLGSHVHRSRLPGNHPSRRIVPLVDGQGVPAEAKQWLADTAEKAFNTPTFQKFMKDNGLILLL